MNPSRFEADTGIAWMRLRKYKKQLNRQQAQTIGGQIKAGDIYGAMKGLSRLLDRKGAKSGEPERKPSKLNTKSTA